MFILPLIDTPSKESERTVPMGIRISICGSSHGQEVKRHREAFCLSPVHSLGNQSIGKRPITQAMSHRVEPGPKSCALKLASLFSTICPKIHIADNDNNDGYNGQCQLHVCQASHSTGEHPPTCPGGDITPIRQEEAQQGQEPCLQESYGGKAGTLHAITHTRMPLPCPGTRGLLAEPKASI